MVFLFPTRFWTQQSYNSVKNYQIYSFSKILLHLQTLNIYWTSSTNPIFVSINHSFLNAKKHAPKKLIISFESSHANNIADCWWLFLLFMKRIHENHSLALSSVCGTFWRGVDGGEKKAEKKANQLLSICTPLMDLVLTYAWLYYYRINE